MTMAPYPNSGNGPCPLCGDPDWHASSGECVKNPATWRKDGEMTSVCQTCEQPLHVVGPVWSDDKGRYHIEEPDERNYSRKCYVDSYTSKKEDYSGKAIKA